jgi:hypothetical protein
MNLDPAKIDEAVLALMHLSLHHDRGYPRTWKSFDWDALDRLHERGLIASPRSKARSVLLTEEGVVACERACVRLFGAA